MPPSPKGMFRCLGKLDYAFTSLLKGSDIETGEELPGFEGKKGVDGTQKVRIKGIAERTRVSVVEALKKGEFEFEAQEEDDGQEEDEEGGLVLEGDVGDIDEPEEDLEIAMGRVYDKTLQELGDSLEPPSTGALTG
jgi:hypothetical protein